ncbi:MAG: alpha/beta fold hydrolase [Bdellovibrio sp.]
MQNENTSIEFTEKMTGSFIPHRFVLSPFSPLPRQDFIAAERREDRQNFEFILTICVPNLENYLIDPSTPSQVTGKMTDFRFAREVAVERGYFQLFTQPSASPDFDTAKEMHYTLFLTDQEGCKWTFFGFKELLKECPGNGWQQTTTLYYYIWEGHSTFENYGDKQVHAIGTLHIAFGDFLQQLRSFKTNAASFFEEKKAILRYFKSFAGNLWESYAPYIFTTTAARWNDHTYPLHTTQGVNAGEKTLHPLDTRDGLTISLQRFKVRESKNVVLLLHGLTTSTDMFIMPEHQNLVNHLHREGFTDVWSLDWRGSSRFAYNLTPHNHSVDDVAKYDIPSAVEFIRTSCGSDVKIHVIAHCVGALSLMASYAAGYISNLGSIIANSVSLTPKVRWQSFLKMMVGPEVLEHAFRYTYVTPKVGYLPGRAFGKWIYWMERSFRRECKEPACHVVSFMWGWGFPAAFKHRNIHPITHRRLMDLFGGTSFHYYRHIRKMLLAKASVSWSDTKPIHYLDEMKNRALPPTLLISGEENHIFPGSNLKTYQILKDTPQGANVFYQEFPQYGHQDIFMGQYCHQEVFPALTQFLQSHAANISLEQEEPLKLRIA